MSLPPAPTRTHPKRRVERRTRHNPLLIALSVLLVALLIIGIILATHWPFAEPRVRAGLERGFHGTVEIKTYRMTFFPTPGFVASGLVLRRGRTPDEAAHNPAPPFMTAENLVVQASWSTLLTLQRRAHLVDLTNLHVTFPAKGTRAYEADFPPGDGKDFSGPRTFIETIHVAHSTLEFQKVADLPLLLQVHDLLLMDVVKDHGARFSTSLECPRPDALVEAEGFFGPMHSTRLAETPVRADYTFRKGRLEDFKNLHGIIDAHGSFHGPLSALETSADASVHGFAVGKGRPIDATNEVEAVVNGLNGDVQIRKLDAHFLHTSIHASGTIAGRPKVTRLDLSLQHGRVEDVMHPFFNGPVPVAGDLHVKAHALLAAGTKGEKFLDRLTMDGVFDIPDERFTKVSTEESFSAFSRRARGENPLSADAKKQPLSAADPPMVMSIRGPARLSHSVASSPHLDVTFPGASMLLAGTFVLPGSTAHFTGNLMMQSDLSHVTTGWKSILLKPISPFFKHHTAAQPEGPRVTVVPIAITGSHQFKVSSNLMHKK